ncbi:MAG: glycine cleavage system protein GcvH [Pseudomonadota bacterium]
MAVKAEPRLEPQTVSRAKTDEHEWLVKDGDVITVGITEHATTQLGDIVFVELPEVGAEISKGDEIVVIESVKAASDITAPLDGEVTAVNEALAENPALANESPLGDGWFFKIKPVNASDMDDYMDEAAYNEMIG